MNSAQFYGYRRPDGKVGIRNYVAVIPTSVCASSVALQVADQVPQAVALYNQHGCCQIGADFAQTVQTLIGLGKNPNVGAVLVIGLGCEGVPIRETAQEIAKTGKPVETLIIQECGGTLKTIAKALEYAGHLAQEISALKREPFPVTELVIGVECGGSDFTSGLASNPAAGEASDLLVKAGGTSMLSETTEFIGAEHILARRGKTPAVQQKILDLVAACEERSLRGNVDLREGQPTPGNKEGGITSIEEKSLGCIHKAGTETIQDVLAYGEAPSGKGLYVMDTPGQDIESLTGMVAGGATIIVFTTGRGTPTGFPLAPVIKITGNKETFAKMKDNIDLDVSAIIDGKQSISSVGEEIFREILRVADGKMTKAESLGHKEFGIYKIGPTF